MILGRRYRNFHQKDKSLWQCSCPICGDSHKNKSKARGFFYRYKNEMFYKCHNCSVSMKFVTLLKDQDERLYNEYLSELLVKHKGYNPKPDPVYEEMDVGHTPTFKNIEILKGLTPISQLPKDHFVSKYVRKRMIPEKFYDKLFLVDKFMTWSNTLVPEKFSDETIEKYESPRLVMPFYDKFDNIFAFTGRSFDPRDKNKYIQIRLDEKSPKIYGLDRVDKSKRVYILEGPINSLFLDNAVATAGINNIGSYFKDYVYVLDNDRRNIHVGNSLLKLIIKGNNVCIWDDSIPEKKDINDLILMGWTSEQIKNLIDKCTCSGLEAQLKFQKWRKY